MKNLYWLLCKSNCTILFLLVGGVTFAQCIPNFGSASNYALFTISGAVGNTGISTINGNIGTNTGAITGFSIPTIVNGSIYTPDTATSMAAIDLIAAYHQLFNATATNTSHTPAFGSNEILTAGVYSIGGAGSIAGNLILDGEGNAEAIFIFKFGGAFTTGASTNIILINSANAANIFWISEGAIGMAASTTMQGTLIANNAAASMGDQSVLNGRLYSTTGAVSVYGTTVDITGIESNTISGVASPDQTICSGTSPADLSVTGNSGTILKWQKATSPTFLNPIDINSNLAILPGSVIGSLSATTYFRAVLQSTGCIASTAYSPQCIVTISCTIWDGNSWSNGLPTASKSITFSGDMTSSEDISGYSMLLTNGAKVTVLSGHSIILNGALTVEPGSRFELKNGASLIQLTDEQNSGDISVEKITAPLKRLDYVLWSTPVENQLLLDFSPLTLTNRFYSYDAAFNYFVAVASPATSPFPAGLSRLIRMPYNHPTSPHTWTGTFTGQPINGTVDLTVLPDTYNAVGNPYPSGINADLFMAQNNITEALYFWRKTNNSANTSYAVYTSAGGTSNSGGDPLLLAPGQIIPIGQGFLAKSTSNTITFNNSMRLAAIDVPLLRTAEGKSRIWLDMTSTNGFFGQLLVAYMANATLGIDNAIDGRSFNDCPTALTSIITNEQFTIQGRPLPFEVTDVIAIGFKSEFANTFTISINHLDGVFQSEQAIFIKDNVLGILHDIKITPYTFSTQAGVFNNRFELVYQNVLGTNPLQIDSNQIIIYKQNSNLIIKSGQTIMKEVKVFDVAGRLLKSIDSINGAECQMEIKESNQTLIVKITSDTNEIIAKKVIF